MEFKCSGCEYSNDTRKNVIRHINRKNKCVDGDLSVVDIIVNNNCEYCKKAFVTKPSMKRHLKICKIKKISQDDEIKKLKEELAIAKALAQKPTTSITNNNNNTQININLAPWNNPLLPSDVERYYRESVKKIFLAVPTLIKYIHFNTEHPENHNICIKNGRSKTAKVYNGKEWETIDEDQLIRTLIDDYEQTLEDYSEVKKLTFSKKYQEIKDRDGEDKVYDDLHNEVKRVIYDRNRMVKIKN
jgi:hypothetical protein